MCHRVICPNDGKPTWWGCGGHIEQALAGVRESERCKCPHERIPWLPIMQRVVKRDRSTRISTGTSNDAGLNIKLVSDDTDVLAITSTRRDCSVKLRMELPRGVLAGDAYNVVKTDTGVEMRIDPPSIGVEVPLVGASGAVLGPDAGTLRAQWTCEGRTGDMADVHAVLVNDPPRAGFLSGAGIEPTHVVAVLVLAWVAYRFFTGAGAGAPSAADRGKRE